MQPTAAAMEQQLDDAQETSGVSFDDMTELQRLLFLASQPGDLTPFLSNEQLSKIGAQCLEDYHADLSSREDWEEKAKTALKRSKQEAEDEKTWPWKGASNASFPLLTTAALQFAARSYGAIVKGDEVVSCKVIGSDKGLPVMGQDGQPVMQVQGMPVVMGPQGPVAMTPAGPQPVPPGMQPEPVWQRPPGAKATRATRVREFMNYTIFYRMKGWEEDTDTMLHHLPIIGCGFRKVYPVGSEQRSEYVPALKLVAPMDAKSCELAPRLTEIREGLRHNDIVGQQRAGFYRDVVLVEDADCAGLRTLLEQHCLIDLDDDGYAEPYVVTLDEESGEVLRVEANFGEADVSLTQGEVAYDAEGYETIVGQRVTAIRRECYYVKYDFFPNLDGGFYGLGLGHLLDNITKIVNNTINQMIDAGTAAAAGGGFIGSGVDLTGAGKRSSSIQMMPGYYKTVNAPGSAIRDAIYERTYPGPNPVTFQVLELMLGAAKEISSIKDVLQGEGNNNGQVGTTLALIEQGLQVYTSIYKRIYRSLKEEYTKLFHNIGRYGGEEAQQAYVNVLDEPSASLEQDFNSEDFDVRPVSDPTSVTRMQKMARAQFLGQFLAAPGMNPQEIIKRMLEAADVEDMDTLFMPPAEPDPMQQAAMQAEVEKLMAAGLKDQALAKKAEIDGQVAIAREQREGEQAQLEALAEGFRAGAQG